LSKWRVELDASFSTESDAVAFLNLVQEIKGKFYKGTEKVLPVYDEKTGITTPGIPGDGIPVIIKCRYHECFHDENPPKQCGNYINYDLKKEAIDEVKTKDGVKVSPDDLLKKGGV
jgi:hypothetical protein